MDYKLRILSYKFIVQMLVKVIYLRAQTVVVAQLVRAPDCGSGGRGFESHHPPFRKPFHFGGAFCVRHPELDSGSILSTETFRFKVVKQLQPLFNSQSLL